MLLIAMLMLLSGISFSPYNNTATITASLQVLPPTASNSTPSATVNVTHASQLAPSTNGIEDAAPASSLSNRYLAYLSGLGPGEAALIACAQLFLAAIRAV